MKKVAYLFPGQGAQAVGMGVDFYQTFEEARKLIEMGAVVCPLKVLFEGPDDQLKRTEYSQPAIFIVSMAIMAAIEKQFPELQPSVVGGLSLGEFSALTAAHKLSFDKALELVAKRARAMNEACEATEGAMAAIFGLSIEEVTELATGIEGLFVANYNCPGQTVISGACEAVELGSSDAKERGAKRVIPLNVHGAFHSGLMQLAADQLESPFSEVEVSPGRADVVMNVTGAIAKSADEVRENMIRQVTSSVKWEQSIRAMGEVDLYIEIGPGRTLAGMNRQIGCKAPTISVNKVEDLEKLAEALGYDTSHA